ncbi:hypothetical protein CHARACLAT_023572 [Characodon lateralis]|uniref:Uncharacterized protein n=1 Tax=Characodon lateralis TaxID=208331 RepID=A0ABU7ECB1_9TELE|nr:hypothetical protein [Characodon lateralis]
MFPHLNSMPRNNFLKVRIKATRGQKQQQSIPNKLNQLEMKMKDEITSLCGKVLQQIQNNIYVCESSKRAGKLSVTYWSNSVVSEKTVYGIIDHYIFRPYFVKMLRGACMANETNENIKLKHISTYFSPKIISNG